MFFLCFLVFSDMISHVIEEAGFSGCILPFSVDQKVFTLVAKYTEINFEPCCSSKFVPRAISVGVDIPFSIPCYEY